MPEKKTAEKTVAKEEVKTTPVAEKDTKTIKDTDTFKVKSLVPNVHYTCPKTQDYYIWADIGDEEEMTFAQLKTLKNRHIGYFSKQWLTVTDKEVMKKLGVDKYFNNKFTTKDFALLYGNDVDAVEKKLALIPEDQVDKFKKKVIDGVKNGSIANVKIIRVLEKTFDVDLMTLV